MSTTTKSPSINSSIEAPEPSPHEQSPAKNLKTLSEAEHHALQILYLEYAFSINKLPVQQFVLRETMAHAHHRDLLLPHPRRIIPSTLLSYLKALVGYTTSDEPTSFNAIAYNPQAPGSFWPAHHHTSNQRSMASSTSQLHNSDSDSALTQNSSS
jgi:hypothetical protein